MKIMTKKQYLLITWGILIIGILGNAFASTLLIFYPCKLEFIYLIGFFCILIGIGLGFANAKSIIIEK